MKKFQKCKTVKITSFLVAKRFGEILNEIPFIRRHFTSTILQEIKKHVGCCSFHDLVV